MKLRAFCDVLEKLAPTRHAAKWDNVGILVESADCIVEKVLLTNDLTPKVMQEAIDFKANLIVAYHPPLFEKFKRISQDNWKDRIVTQALKNSISIYSPHTAHDAWSVGVNAWLIEGVINDEKHYPISPLVDMREMYQISGTLMATGDAKKMKKIFNKIQISEDNELSGVLSKSSVPKFSEDCSDHVQNLKFEVLGGLPITGTGMGRKAKLNQTKSLKDIIEDLKKHLNLPHLRLVLGVEHSLESEISSIAVCAGSGASVLVNAGKVDLWITGEMGHHEALDCQEKNISVLLAEHSNTERGFLSRFQANIMENAVVTKKNIEFKISEFDKDPISVC